MTRATEPGSVASGDAAREVESLAGASAPPEEHDRACCLWCDIVRMEAPEWPQ